MTDADYLLDIFEKSHRDRCGSDRLFCYVETRTGQGYWQLSFVEENEPGHFPVSTDVAIGTQTEMHALAERLNRTRLGLTPSKTVYIVASSMSGNVERRNR